MTALMYIGVAVIGYLLGSIPFGLFIGKIFAKKDVREVGSGKIGMTNVLRAAGKKAAALSLVLDIVKGVLAVIIAGLIFRDKTDTVAAIITLNESAKMLAGFAAIAGHSWSIFLKFKGGRGVATFMGGLAALYWPAALLGGICIFGIGIRTKYMSLGSIIGAVTAFFLLMAFYVLKIDFLRAEPMPFEYVLFAMAGAIFIYIMHRDNILRLFNGTERKIGEKTKVQASPSTNTPK
ncbi:MAG: acyl-phosphate glycerol 3-phosphate acyltransferase [Chloroflexi bacterium RBG_16_50_11]|nr:MAG: acyl-phosphate glycerol 3-phosphate acyltransferase [Chloroflexi bacterium RBG_16_50_11]